MAIKDSPDRATGQAKTLPTRALWVAVRKTRLFIVAAFLLLTVAVLTLGCLWWSGGLVASGWASRTEGQSLAVRQRPLEIQPTIGPVFDPDPVKLNESLRRLKPEVERNLSKLEHALHLYGRDLQVPAKSTRGEVSAVELFLDSEQARRRFGGAESLAATRFGARFPEYSETMLGTKQPTAEAHPGETLAVFAGIGVPLSHPIRLAGGREATLRAVLEDLIANFTLQGQIYWKVVALALYLPPQKSWKNRFGDRFTFDDVARELVARPVSDSPCLGTHGPITLTILLRADEQEPVLSESVRRQVREYLRRIAKTLVEIQSPEGWFPADWQRVLSGKELEPVPRPLPAVPALLATGHHLEWLMLLPDDLRPPQEVFRRAAVWSLEALAGKTADPQWVDEWYCPASHAVRSVILLSRPQEGKAVSRDGPSPRERPTAHPVRVQDSASR